MGEGELGGGDGRYDVAIADRHRGTGRYFSTATVWAGCGIDGAGNRRLFSPVLRVPTVVNVSRNSTYRANSVAGTLDTGYCGFMGKPGLLQEMTAFGLPRLDEVRTRIIKHVTVSQKSRVGWRSNTS